MCETGITISAKFVLSFRTWSGNSLKSDKATEWIPDILSKSEYWDDWNGLYFYLSSSVNPLLFKVTRRFLLSQEWQSHSIILLKFSCQSGAIHVTRHPQSRWIGTAPSWEHKVYSSLLYPSVKTDGNSISTTALRLPLSRQLAVLCIRGRLG